MTRGLEVVVHEAPLLPLLEMPSSEFDSFLFFMAGFSLLLEVKVATLLALALGRRMEKGPTDLEFDFFLFFMDAAGALFSLSLKVKVSTLLALALGRGLEVRLFTVALMFMLLAEVLLWEWDDEDMGLVLLVVRLVEI